MRKGRGGVGRWKWAKIAGVPKALHRRWEIANCRRLWANSARRLPRLARAKEKALQHHPNAANLWESESTALRGVRVVVMSKRRPLEHGTGAYQVRTKGYNKDIRYHKETCLSLRACLIPRVSDNENICSVRFPLLTRLNALQTF